jgi:hypothetical protein
MDEPIVTTARSPRPPRPTIPGWAIKYKNYLIMGCVTVPMGTVIASMYFLSQPYRQVDTPPELDPNAVVQEAQSSALAVEQQMKLYLDGGSEPGEIYRIQTVKAREIQNHVDKAVRKKGNVCYRLKKNSCFDLLEAGVKKELETAALDYKTDNYLLALSKYKAIQLAREKVPSEDVRPSTFKVLVEKVQDSRKLESQTSIENQSTEVLIQKNEANEAEDNYEQ